MRIPFPRSLFSPLAVLLLAAVAPAQIPDGWAIAVARKNRSLAQGGVYLVQPLTGTTVTVGGPFMPPDLTGAAAGPGQGSSSVVRDRVTGELIIGESLDETAGGRLELHYLAVDSSGTVTAARRVWLGDAVPPTSLTNLRQIALLSTGDVFVAVSGGGAAGLTVGPLAGVRVGLVSPNGTVTPLAPGLPAPPVACAAAPGGGVYVGTFAAAPATSDVWWYDPYTNARTRLATFPTGVWNLAVENSGTVLAACVGAAPHLWRIDPSTPMAPPTAVPTGLTEVAGVCVEPATGDLLLTAGTPFGVYRLPRTGPAILLNVVSGAATGIAVNPDPESYGAPSPIGSPFRWSVTPNPGGLPLCGSTTFSLTVAGPGAPLSLLLLGTQQLVPPLPGPGIDLWTLPIVIVPCTLPTFPLPLPPCSGGSWGAIYLQSVHLTGSTLMASDGLALTIMQ